MADKQKTSDYLTECGVFHLGSGNVTYYENLMAPVETGEL